MSEFVRFSCVALKQKKEGNIMNKRIYSLLTVVCIVLNLMVYFPLPTFAATYGDLTYKIENNQVIITDCNEDTITVNIPATIEGYPVTTIGDSAFRWCELTKITIPSGVITIEHGAFSQCKYLTDITISGSVTSIEDYAFDNCASLTKIIIPDSVTTIGSYAFRDCVNLTDISLSDGTISINKRAFYNCDSLTDILISGNVLTIGEEAFSNCDSLANITISGNVTTIEDHVFMGCDNLTNITISGNVTTIESAFNCCESLANITISGHVTTISGHAFYSCESLTDITISGSVTTIEDDAFSQCDNLTDITISGSVTNIEDHAFVHCDSLINVYYSGSEQDWKKVVRNEEISEIAKVTYNSDSTMNNPTRGWNSKFSDLPSNHWAYDAIMELADLGVINGMGDGTYNPDGTVTREQFIKLLVCANDEQNDSYPAVDFVDVDDNSWSYEYICTGLSNGIFGLDELEDDKFEPQKGIDRDTVALWSVNKLGVWLDEENDFKDSFKIDNTEAVATAVEEGIIVGYEDNTFRPDNTLTRAEAAVIIKRTIDKISDNKTLRFSPNIVKKNEDVMDVYSDNNTNILVDFDIDKGYYKFKNIDDDIEALTKGDIFTIPPSYEIPSGVAIKVKTINITGTTAEIWSDSIEADEVFDEIDISTMISGDLGYVAENSVPKGIEVTNAKGQTIAMAKEALKVDNNYFYASTGGFQQTLKGTEELDLLKFKLEYEKDSHTKISGEITVLNPQFVVDFKYNAWDGLQYAELKAVLSCDAEVKYEKKLESREEDLTRIPLAKLVMPVGATGLFLEGNLYCDVGIDGNVEVNFETSQSFETGVKYEHGKLKNIKEQKNESALSATAEGTIKFGPNTELTLSAYGVINLKFGFEAGLKIDMELAKEIKATNGVKTFHKCDLCIDGDLSGYFEVGGDITLGKGIFKVTLIEAKNEWEYVIADFYISRQFDEDKGIFGWGECDNFVGDTVNSENNDNNDTFEPFDNNINGLGNIYSGNFAISDGKYIYFLHNSKSQIYRTDMDGSNQIVLATFGKPGLVSCQHMCIHNGYIYATLWKFLSGSEICRISLDTGNYKKIMDLPDVEYFQIVDNAFLFSEDNKIYKLPLDATSYEQKILLAQGSEPVCYNGLIYFNENHELYKMNFKGENQEFVLSQDTRNVIIHNDKLYFNDDYKIYSSDLDGTNVKLLYEEKYERIGNLNIHDNNVYYTLYSNSFFERNKLKCMSLNGENISTISTNCRDDVCIVGDWVYTTDRTTVLHAKMGQEFELIID